MSDDEVQILDDQQCSVPVSHHSSSNNGGPSLFPPTYLNHDFSHISDTKQYERNVTSMKGNFETLKDQLKEIHLIVLTGEDMLYYMDQFKSLVSELDSEHGKKLGDFFHDSRNSEEAIETALSTHHAYEEIAQEIAPFNSTIDDFVLESNRAVRDSVDAIKELKATFEMQCDFKKMFTTLKDGISVFKKLKEQSEVLQDLISAHKPKLTRSSVGRQTKMDSFTADNKASSKTSPHFSKMQTYQARMISESDPSDPKVEDFFQSTPAESKKSESKLKQKNDQDLRDFVVGNDFVEFDRDSVLPNRNQNQYRNTDRKLESLDAEENYIFQQSSTRHTKRRMASNYYLREEFESDESETHRQQSPKGKKPREEEDDEEWIGGESKKETDDEGMLEPSKSKSASKKRKSTSPMEDLRTTPVRGSTGRSRSSSKAGPVDEVIVIND